MHKKVMLVLPNGSRCWGYATTEHPEKSEVPYITVKNRRTDDYVAIICNDEETAELLRTHGYLADGTQTTKTGLTIPTQLYQAIKTDAESKKIKVNGLIVDILKEHYNERD